VFSKNKSGGILFYESSSKSDSENKDEMVEICRIEKRSARIVITSEELKRRSSKRRIGGG